jgi:hypothetical protein
MKCPVCTSKKGKRACLLTKSSICTLCCGTHRTKETCYPCIYYQEPKRNYAKIPFYRPDEMDGHFERQDIANMIESAISTFDYKTGDKIQDEFAIHMIEILLDVYYFKQPFNTSNDKLLDDGCRYVLSTLENALADTAHEEMSKILGAIYFVARRRTQGGRQYLNLIRQYVGIRVGSGMRVLSV